MNFKSPIIVITGVGEGVAAAEADGVGDKVIVEMERETGRSNILLVKLILFVTVSGPCGNSTILDDVLKSRPVVPMLAGTGVGDTLDEPVKLDCSVRDIPDVMDTSNDAVELLDSGCSVTDVIFHNVVL